MLGNVLVSGSGRLGVLSLGQGKMVKETTLESCAAVCERHGTVFTAVEDDSAIYRLNRELLPIGVYAGGPGMRALCVSGDGERLFLLLCDADSVMMLSAEDGSPMILARAGVNPQRMRLDEDGRCLVIAGGKDGSTLLLCPDTLNVLMRLRDDGICCDALIIDGSLCMLYMTGAMNTRLVLRRMDGARRSFLLSGMPGSLLAVGHALLVSAGDWLYAFDVKEMKMTGKKHSAGVCGKLLFTGRQLLLLSPVYETLSTLDASGRKLICRGVKDAAVSE